MTRPGQGYIKNLGSPKLRNLARFLSCFGASIALAPQTFSALSNTFLFNARCVSYGSTAGQWTEVEADMGICG